LTTLTTVDRAVAKKRKIAAKFRVYNKVHADKVFSEISEFPVNAL